MSRGRNAAVSLVAALLAGLLVYGVYVVLIRQVELQKTVQVVVPKDFIAPGTLIGREMLELRTLAEGGVREGMLTDMEAAVGQETLVPLGAQEPILDWKIDRFHLLPGKNEATFPIPKEYVLSIPGGIRAGDLISVYASGKLGTVKLLPDNITVASVRTSANMEVEDPKNPNLMAKVQTDKEKMYASRREASGAVEQLNLNLTEEEWRLIDEACRSKQNKLVIAFRSASILGMDEGGN